MSTARSYNCNLKNKMCACDNRSHLGSTESQLIIRHRFLLCRFFCCCLFVCKIIFAKKNDEIPIKKKPKQLIEKYHFF